MKAAAVLVCLVLCAAGAYAQGHWGNYSCGGYHIEVATNGYAVVWPRGTTDQPRFSCFVNNLNSCVMDGYGSEIGCGLSYTYNATSVTATVIVGAYDGKKRTCTGGPPLTLVPDANDQPCFSCKDCPKKEQAASTKTTEPIVVPVRK